MGQSSSVFWAHGDSVLSTTRGTRIPYSKEELRLSMIYHALFAEHLCIVDACLIDNAPLIRLLMYEGYDVFLSNSILIPMLRASASNFSELQHKGPTYRTVANPIGRAFANFLDKISPTILSTDDKYSTDVLSESYRKTLLHSDFLAKTGLQPIESDLRGYTEKYQTKYGTPRLRRSIFFYFADELAQKHHPKYAAKLKWLSSAIWNDAFLTDLDLRPAFPHTYSEAILKILSNERVPMHLEAEYTADVASEDFALTPSDLYCLNANNVLEIRRTKEAKCYFNKARQGAKENDPSKARKHLVEGLQSYLPILSQRVAEIATGKGDEFLHTRRMLRLMTFGGNLGGSLSTGLGLVSLAAGSVALGWIGLGAGALVWILGGFVEKKISNQQQKELGSA